VDVKVALDSCEVLSALSERAAAAGRTVGVLVEVDMGLGRVGVQGAEAAVALAREADRLPGVEHRGVLFYPGHIRMPPVDQAEALAALGTRLTPTLDALEGAGLPAGIVSGGSTPTLWNSHRVPGLTEIRPGSGIFFDKEALEIGVATLEDVAYTVLATVVSTSVPGRAVVDAGSKSLTTEARGAANFGFLLDHPEVTLAGLSEEHGVLDVSRSTWVPVIGERVRIVPNHVCVSVNLQDALLAVDGGEHRLLALEGRGRARWNG
jgi:D-serine deaminase-like pyridoxal phosphate-dependent protein